MSCLQEHAYRRVSPKSDDSIAQFSSLIFIVVFGGDVRRTEGVPSLPASLPSLPRLDCIDFSKNHGYTSLNHEMFAATLLHVYIDQ